MDQNRTSIFQIGLLMVFGFIGVSGIIAFTLFQTAPGSDSLGDVLIWGTLDERITRVALEEVNQRDVRLSGVDYEQIPEDQFIQRTLEAFAAGRGPDLMLIDDTQLHYFLDKIFILDNESYAQSKFSNTFVDAGNIFLQNGGVAGVPIAADSLVMFWNRDLFANVGLARPPEQWGDFFELTNALTVVDGDLNIQRSAIGLGEGQNVNNLREILATLFLQEENPIVRFDGTLNEYQAVLQGGRDFESIESALRFFTEFSNPTRNAYSWNRALPRTDQAFLSGSLATYFGLGSEVGNLRQRNPNLNFAVAEIPSVTADVTRAKSVYSKVFGFVIPLSSGNAGGALAIADILSQSQNMQGIVNALNLAPVHRDLVSRPSDEPYKDILKKQAIYSDSFLDPNPQKTSQTFRNMVESITSGRRSITDAINVAHEEINAEL